MQGRTRSTKVLPTTGAINRATYSQEQGEAHQAKLYGHKIPTKQTISQEQEGQLVRKEIQTLVKDWHDRRSEGNLRQETIEMETKAMEKKLRRYNVEQLGEMPLDQEDGLMRILVCQMGGCASKEARELKMAATEKLIRKYDINLCLFMELNFNWTKVSSSANLASWFNKEEREMRCFTAHNTQEFDETLGRHQLGGTGMVCRHEFLQYMRKPSADFRGLGRWCSWPFFCNPTHITRIVVAYCPCLSKVKGLKWYTSSNFDTYK